PVLNVVPGQSVDEGDFLNLPNLGQITQATSDPFESWTFSVDWGDGGMPDSGSAIVDSTGHGHFDGGHVYSVDGSYTVTVRVENNEGLAATKTFTVTVNEVEPELDDIEVDPVKEGEIVDIGDVAFEDPDYLDVHTATIDWGDGTSPDPGTIAYTLQRDGDTT